MDNESPQLDYHAIGSRYIREIAIADTADTLTSVSYETVKSAADIALILKIQAMSEFEAMMVVEQIETDPLSIDPMVYALIRATFPRVEAFALNFNTFKQLERMKVQR